MFLVVAVAAGGAPMLGDNSSDGVQRGWAE